MTYKLNGILFFDSIPESENILLAGAEGFDIYEQIKNTKTVWMFRKELDGVKATRNLPI